MDGSSCNSSAIVQGVGMSFVPAPLHKIYLQSPLASGFFTVAVFPALPIKGVDFILSNDLAGGKVIPIPEVFDSPGLNADSDNSTQNTPDIFPACAVTRAQSKKYGLDLSDSFLVTEHALDADMAGPKVNLKFTLRMLYHFSPIKRMQNYQPLGKHSSQHSKRDWDEGVPLVLFAAREAVQESLGFSPAELVFGHEVRGPLKVLKEHLVMPKTSVKSIPEYVTKLKDRLQLACSLAREALASSQLKMKKRYDRKAVVHSFQPEKKLCENNYIVKTPDCRRQTRICHVNMMKLYRSREDQNSSSSAHVKTAVSPMASVSKYTVMPFGMCNAPATFQRLVNKVLGDVQNCKAYLDDIVVYSGDWISHVTTLREVFTRLSSASLTLNLTKCEFGKGTVLYLGQQVGQGQVCPVDIKITAIATFPVPMTRRELRRFLGMVGYYRLYCKIFSSVAASLTTLTSPLKPFAWNEECQQAFECLKGLLSCNPVLSAPDFSVPFKLEVDASAVGAGAVLLQEATQGIDHPSGETAQTADTTYYHYTGINILLSEKHIPGKLRFFNNTCSCDESSDSILSRQSRRRKLKIEAGLTSDQKMSVCVEEEEDRSESAGSSCLSMKSDRSKELPPAEFSNEPGPSDTKERKRSHVSVEEQPSCCASCQDVLKDPVSTSCGHWFCRQCITSYWDQSASSGDSSCPQCGERSRTRAGLQTASQTSSVQTDGGLQQVLDEYKISLRRRCERVTEGTDEAGSGTLLNRIYTELYITEGQSEEVNTQHEVRQLETANKMKIINETPIKCHDIFKALPDQQKHIRVVLTNGVAGVGKTFSVQKFTLDWAEGLENQDVSLLILFSFRELNLIKDEQYSLLMLLHVFHPTLQKVTAEQLAV
ncbi:hypothetical protein L3Q82_000078 [Scortum barcoo]|uniref:Uncharacterized protein n=1 Tax=Scortum barcoo TaxID=214431 RepID=A0ACB8X902_9TELE|nr:hypothetical protein L3Q82_000078 [Scortum barcoo]